MNNMITTSMDYAAQGMRAQAFRLRIASENLSNADTHGYQRKQVSFVNELDRQTGNMKLSIGKVTLDQSVGELLFDPAHPLADANGYVRMSNVDMMIELADAREASRSYEANLNTFSQARSMYKNLLDLIRR